MKTNSRECCWWSLISHKPTAARIYIVVLDDKLYSILLRKFLCGSKFVLWQWKLGMKIDISRHRLCMWYQSSNWNCTLTGVKKLCNRNLKRYINIRVVREALCNNAGNERLQMKSKKSKVVTALFEREKFDMAQSVLCLRNLGTLALSEGSQC